MGRQHGFGGHRLLEPLRLMVGYEDSRRGVAYTLVAEGGGRLFVECEIHSYLG